MYLERMSNLPAGVRPIPNYPGYGIGADGVPWSTRVRGRIDGPAKRMKVRRVGKYLMVSLCRGSRSQIDQRYVHHLVLFAFVGPKPEGMEAIHKNDIQDDNRAENLEWGTHQRNCEIRRTNGRDSRRILTEDSARWALSRKGIEKRKDIASRCGVSVAAIADLFGGRTWKHIQRE